MKKSILNIIVFSQLILASTLGYTGGHALSFINAKNSCSLDNRPAIKAKVIRINDGDTITVTTTTTNHSNKFTVRLLGINTPESGSRKYAPQAYSKEASAALKKFLSASNNQILLVTSEKPDRYGRVLAHVFTKDGANAQRYLLAKGLAFNMVYPPNLAYQSCYNNATRKAQKLKRNIWQHQYYKPLDVKTLSHNNVLGFRNRVGSFAGRNFNHITGTVTSVRNSRHSIWINFEKNRLAIRIPRKNLQYFTQFQPHELKGQKIIVHGYISLNRSRHPRAAKYYMVLRHPDMMGLQ